MYDDDIVNDMKEIMDELVGLIETKKETSIRNAKLQLQAKNLYDKKEMERKFDHEDLILMWNARIEDKGKHGKCDPIYLGPYLIYSTCGEYQYVLK